jgi:hypothetical protein
MAADQKTVSVLLLVIGIAAALVVGVTLGVAGMLLLETGLETSDPPAPQTKTEVLWLEMRKGTIHIRIEPLDDWETAEKLKTYLNKFPHAKVSGQCLPKKN